MTTPSLLNWIMDLLRNNDAREAFNANPQAAMASAGLSASCGSDVKDAHAFIVDHPDVKWSVHEDHHHHNHKHHGDDDDDAVTHIKNIINNYTYNIENNHFDIEDDGDEDGVQIAGEPGDGGNSIEDSTVTDSLNHVETSEANGNAATGGTVVDQSGSTVGDDQVGRDDVDITSTIGDGSTGGDDNSTEIDGDGNVGGNQVNGDGSAGRDIINNGGDDDSVDADGDIDETDGGLAALDHTVETGDIHVLSDLVNVDDSLNDSLNGLAVLNNFESLDLADVTGPLL